MEKKPKTLEEFIEMYFKNVKHKDTVTTKQFDKYFKLDSFSKSKLPFKIIGTKYIDMDAFNQDVYAIILLYQNKFVSKKTIATRLLKNYKGTSRIALSREIGKINLNEYIVLDDGEVIVYHFKGDLNE